MSVQEQFARAMNLIVKPGKKKSYEERQLITLALFIKKIRSIQLDIYNFFFDSRKDTFWSRF